MAEELNRWFFERGNAYGQQAHKKMLYNSKHQGNTMTYHLIHVRMDISKKNKNVEQRIPSFTVGGNVNWYSHYGKQYEGFSKN